MLTFPAVKAVEKEAKELLKREHPHLTDADLDISMSDKVKKDTERKIQQAGAEARGELWRPDMGMHGDPHGGGNRFVGMGPMQRPPMGLFPHGFPPAVLGHHPGFNPHRRQAFVEEFHNRARLNGFE
jgi:hypothetical protein